MQILWQLALLYFLVIDLCGRRSLLDENYIWWMDKTSGFIVMEITIHVDDLLVGYNNPTFMTWILKEFEKRFGSIKRQKLPFVHNGFHYSRMPTGAIKFPWQRPKRNSGCLAGTVPGDNRGIMCPTRW